MFEGVDFSNFMQAVALCLSVVKPPPKKKGLFGKKTFDSDEDEESEEVSLFFCPYYHLLVQLV